MIKNEAKVVVRDSSDASFKGYQSQEALEQATLKSAEDIGLDQPKVAEILVQAPEKMVAVDPVEMETLVRVRPRETIPSMRYGKRLFSFQAGKEVLVPKFVQQHLLEKGII
jgi:hypothetical protein